MEIKPELSMKIETINRRRNSIFFVAMLGIICFSCALRSSCDQPNLTLYRGISFPAESNVELKTAEGEKIISEYFALSYRRTDYVAIREFCCEQDSCKLIYSLNKRDTAFYITPSATKRLMIGSNSKGRLVVATDRNKMAWIDL